MKKSNPATQKLAETESRASSQGLTDLLSEWYSPSNSHIFDVLIGTSGPDCLMGGNGHDILFGDGLPKIEKRVIDFSQSATWQGAVPGAAEMQLPMLLMRSTNGTLSSYHGVGILSPSDSGAQRWTFEIDSYNDQPEKLHLDFELPQSCVTLTVNLLYREPIILPEIEKVSVNVRFADGSTASTSIAAVPTGGALGEATLTLDSASFGGRAIVGIDLQPDPALPVVPPHLQAQFANNYNAHHPYSEFTLKSVAYERDISRDPGNDDVLKGGNGKDLLWGGSGDDCLFGGNGKDLLIGGSGDNLLVGGNGDDTFLFGADARGSNVITDFERGDRAALFDVSVTGTDVSSLGTILHLSNGGQILFEGVFNPSDISLLQF